MDFKFFNTKGTALFAHRIWLAVRPSRCYQLSALKRIPFSVPFSVAISSKQTLYR